MKVCLLVSVAGLATCAMARAQVTVDIDNGSINGLANSLTQQSKTRVLVGPGVAGRVTLHLHGVPLETAVKTAAVVLDLKWRTLWLDAETAPRIRGDEAAKLASAIESVASVPMALDNGTRTVAVRAAPDEAPAKDGLRPVYVFLPKVDPGANAPVTVAPPPEPPQMAASNDPEVVKLQKSFITLSPEQQRTFVNNIRSYMRPGGGGRGNGAGNPNGGQQRRNRRNNNNGGG